ncbi:sodium:solute symporter [Neobacillus sp. PS3-40]|uniref:sodium:solute symporter family protein n=1 Tax=Neobacillus sp. PS3-40 TaxID=3070679 RepID=UPI0027DFBBC1|nr:sodium:solute symporter [Neobacillus sp. PS3-40]WML43022.1 sodium:solute symporter [Neobacillus sp. PS3-40]
MKGNLTALIVTSIIVLAVVFIGFMAGRSKESRSSVEEWSVGGRRLGSLFVWFLIGADIYTAYTFLGLTSTAFKGGSIAFFATPYVVLAYPLAYFFLPKIWKVASVHKFTTLADYIKGRFDSKLFSVLIAINGVLMLIPYIDLQLSGIQDTIRIAGTGYVNVTVVVVLSFILVAFYTFFSGIKAPTYTAILKDILVWVIMLYMVISIPIIHFGSWGHMMQTTVDKAPQMLTLPTSGPKGMLWFSTAALISALALFMWPHTVTGTLSSKSGESLRKNAIILPFYNIVLMLVTFLGITAFLVVPKGTDPRFAFLELIHMSYGGTMQGFAYSTIALASLVPCSIMAIGASSLFANNIYRDVINPKASPSRMLKVTRYMVFVVIGLALLFGLMFPNALVSLQLMGVSGIVQVFPAVVFSLYWRKLSKEAAFTGFIAGMAVVAVLYITHQSFGAYEGFWGLLVNILIVVCLNPFFAKQAAGRKNDVIDTLFGKKNSEVAKQKAV